MKVIIINDDTEPSRSLLVREMDGGNPGAVSETNIGGGLHKEFWIHETKTLRISEVNKNK
jgi:hypothetical protein